ncbi:MAG: serine/threonine protein kinase [Armatimonadetes bacterium]|nr:serine/threonine protein kinase [Armatimonadota bacterium]
MRFGGLLLALIGLLATRCLAEPESVEVTFHTSPPGARIYAEISGTRKYEQYLGRSGEPVLLDLKNLRGRTSFRVVFQLEGYHDRVETIGNYYFNDKARYPEHGAVALDPVHPLTPLVHFGRAHPGVAGGLAALLAGAVGIGLQRARALRARLARGRLLQQYEARAETADPRIMSLLGGYRILEKLGTGGMATVYRAVPDGSLDEQASVAVKIIRPDGVDERTIGRFRREIRLCGALQHPSIVEVLDSGDQDGLLYLVMECVEGKPLNDVIREGGLDPERALEILKSIFSAVAHAHGKGVVHRDLKPANIMVGADGRVRVMDFGLAWGLDSPALTETGHALGTPLYMAPEQVLGKKPDFAVDQYALGCVAFELLTGRPPYQDSEEISVIFRKMNDPVPRVSDYRAGASRALDEAVSRMLAREPAGRYPSVAEAGAALERALSGAS